MQYSIIVIQPVKLVKFIIPEKLLNFVKSIRIVTFVKPVKFQNFFPPVLLNLWSKIYLYYQFALFFANFCPKMFFIKWQNFTKFLKRSHSIKKKLLLVQQLCPTTSKESLKVSEPCTLCAPRDDAPPRSRQFTKFKI